MSNKFSDYYFDNEIGKLDNIMDVLTSKYEDGSLEQWKIILFLSMYGTP